VSPGTPFPDPPWFDDVVPIDRRGMFDVSASPDWGIILREMARCFEDPAPPIGLSPLHQLTRASGMRERIGLDKPLPMLSTEARDLLRDSLDTTLEYYGTSGELEVRGYWMPLDGEERP
jgi:hypothetical protein